MHKFITIGLMLSVIGCADMSRTPSAQSGSTPKDGELAFPSDYKTYPTFLNGIQKPNAVRDLYINPTLGLKPFRANPLRMEACLSWKSIMPKKTLMAPMSKGVMATS